MQKEGKKERGGWLAAGMDGVMAQRIGRYLLLALLGALLTSAPLLFGVHPFGIALIAAAGQAAPACALGAVAYSLLTKEYMTLIAVLAVILVRVGVAFFGSAPSSRTTALFEESSVWRVGASAFACLAVGAFQWARGGFRFFDLFAVLLAVAAAPLATALYFGLFARERSGVPHHFEIAVGAVTLTGIYALRTVSVFGIYPAVVAAAMAGFLLVSHRGIGAGTLGGLLAGLCVSPAMAPAFLLSSLLFALLEKSSRGGGVIAGSVAAGGYAFLLSRMTGVAFLLPSLLVAGALFLAFDSAGLVTGAPVRHLMMARRRAALHSAGTQAWDAGTAQLEEMSGALLDLSGTFYEISSRMRRPGLASLRRLCDKTFDSVCPGCRHRDVCWGSEYEQTVATMGEISRRLYRHGTVQKGHVQGNLPLRCDELTRILNVLNNGATALVEEALHGDKTSVVAMDYAAMGRIINEIIAANKEDFVADVSVGERIFTRLLRMGYSLESVAVCGKTRRRVILRGVRASGRTIRVRELRSVIEKHVHFALGTPDMTEHEGAYDIVFGERETLTTTCVKFTRPKGTGEGKRCGDSVAVLHGARGLDYAVICDGMGSGTAAALTSTLASVFLTRLLQAGGRAESTLRMLNGFLAARSARDAESSTTVDLLEIDLVHGEAALFKCGAAPTYLLRRGEVTRFFSRTAPVGILEALDAERLGFAVEAGDVLVQISDGFSGGEEDCPWLAEMLSERYDGDAEAFARMALNHATSVVNDDLSIVVTEIKPAPVAEGACPVGKSA
ncbi:MAG: hypothetical protein E7650_07265 [Ruminococcaceae bacterium]|nr:hypothetical protein [Oscillospiraceae bacterium]